MRKAAVAAILALARIATPTAAMAGGGPGSKSELKQYAIDTWASLDAMTDKHTGLPGDNIEGELTAPSGYTSPTNIGGYLWSAIVA